MTTRKACWTLLGAALALASCTADSELPDVDRDGVPTMSDCDDNDPALRAALPVYLDADGDGVGAGPTVVLCTDGQAPPGYSLVGTDCAPDDRLAWRVVDDPAVDRDGDGVTARDAVQLCVGTTLPAPYLDGAHGNDCDDADPALASWVILYQDLDGDGVGAGPRFIECRGASLPAGWVRVGADVDDLDPARWAAQDADELLRLLD